MMLLQRGTSRVETDAQTAARPSAGHLRYHQYRPLMGTEQRTDRRLFSATTNRVRPAEVQAAVVAPGCLQVVLHTFILAPEQPVRDYRAWVRGWLAEREAACLCWFGVLHQDAERPHIHVGLVKAQTTSPRVLQSHHIANEGAGRPAGDQGGIMLHLPPLVKKESC